MNSTSDAPDDAKAPVSLDIKRILLVDDDRNLAGALKELLEFHNFVVTTAYHGGEALREIIDVDFDVIICDLMMPHMRGDMFYLAVKKIKPYLNRRFIFITGHISRPELKYFVDTTCVPIIFKPVAIDNLMTMISLTLMAPAYEAFYEEAKLSVMESMKESAEHSSTAN